MHRGDDVSPMVNTYKEYLRVHKDQLVIEAFQRDRVPAHIKKIAAVWNPDFARPLECERRDDGKLSIVDGQHTFEAGLEAGEEFFDIAVPRKARRPYTERAESYIRLHEVQKTQTWYDRFNAWKEADRPLALKIEECITRNGYRRVRGGSTANRSIGATRAVIDIANWDPTTQLLDLTLKVLTAWDGQENQCANQILKGVAQLIRRHPRLDYERLYLRLEKTTPSAVIREARGRVKDTSTRADVAVAQILRQDYNKRLGVNSRLRDPGDV